jgi:hypothetical protein
MKRRLLFITLISLFCFSIPFINADTGLDEDYDELMDDYMSLYSNYMYLDYESGADKYLRDIWSLMNSEDYERQLEIEREILAIEYSEEYIELYDEYVRRFYELMEESGLEELKERIDDLTDLTKEEYLELCGQVYDVFMEYEDDFVKLEREYEDKAEEFLEENNYYDLLEEYYRIEVYSGMTSLWYKVLDIREYNEIYDEFNLELEELEEEYDEKGVYLIMLDEQIMYETAELFPAVYYYEQKRE